MNGSADILIGKLTCVVKAVKHVRREGVQGKDGDVYAAGGVHLMVGPVDEESMSLGQI